MTAAGLTPRTGGCHCGAVRFEADLPAVVEAQTCNCSMCEKVGFIHIIVPESRFRLTSGADQITTYTFNTGAAQTTCRKVCRVKGLNRPRPNPAGRPGPASRPGPTEGLDLRIEAFDGQNWEVHAAALAHLSKED